MDSRDRAALNDLLRLLDAPAQALADPQARLRWTFPTALALILARWSQEGGRQRTLWVDAPSEQEAQVLAHDLGVLLPEAQVAYFPGFAPFAGGESSPPGVVLKDRLATLVGLLEHRIQVLVTGPLAACERLPHPSWFQKQKLELRQGAEVPRELLLETLAALGYRRVDLAGHPGEFSARGLVADLWPDHLETPLRLEFFGDELERLSPFDPDTQRRTGESLEAVVLYPRYEGERGEGEPLLRALEAKAPLTPEAEDDLVFRRSRLASQGHFPGEELFYPLLDHPRGQLTHWVPPCLRVRLDPAWADGIRERERERIQESLAVLRRGGVVCPDFEDRFLPSDPSRPTLLLTEWQSEATVPLQAQPAREFQGRLGELGEFLQEMALADHRVVLAGSTSGMRDRLAEVIQEYELPVAYGTQAGCRAVHLPLSAGVFLKEPRLLLLTEREVFGRKAMAAPPKRSRSAAFMSDLRDLKPGDRVVHLDHGIGEFVGFTALTVGGEDQEVVQLRYADGGVLNVNIIINPQCFSKCIYQLSKCNWLRFAWHTRSLYRIT
jgi:transcription-repair coupling factor (superfamily II helicase)